MLTAETPRLVYSRTTRSCVVIPPGAARRSSLSRGSVRGSAAERARVDQPLGTLPRRFSWTGFVNLPARGVRHGEGDPAGPGGIAANLVLVECGQALARLEELLHPPS